MTKVEAQGAHEAVGPETSQMDVRLEVVLVPISEDQEGEFHLCLGFRLSADFGVMENHRVVRFSPHCSARSVDVGSVDASSADVGSVDGGAGAATDVPAPLDGLTLVVADVADALNELVRRGVQIGDIDEGETGVLHGTTGDPRVVGIDLGRGAERSVAL